MSDWDLGMELIAGMREESWAEKDLTDDIREIREADPGWTGHGHLAGELIRRGWRKTPTCAGPGRTPPPREELAPHMRREWDRLVAPHLDGTDLGPAWALIDNADADDLRHALQACIIRLHEAAQDSR